ncbi:MAG: hypothetical protein WCJ64_26220, partial [Rhodospirillaceae bacterium]
MTPSGTTQSVIINSNGQLGSVSSGSGAGSVTNVTGTADRITVSNGTSTPALDIAATYAGQTTITTLGTITTGTVPVARVSGLGTAALLDVGTTASKVVQLDSSAKLPAVDGSQLTNVSAVLVSDALNNTKGGTSALNNLSTGSR